MLSNNTKHITFILATIISIITTIKGISLIMRNIFKVLKFLSLNYHLIKEIFKDSEALLEMIEEHKDKSGKPNKIKK